MTLVGAMSRFQEDFLRETKALEYLFHEGDVNINNLSFCKHNDKATAHAMIASCCEIEIESDEQKASRPRQIWIGWLSEFKIYLNSKIL